MIITQLTEMRSEIDDVIRHDQIRCSISLLTSQSLPRNWKKQMRDALSHLKAKRLSVNKREG